MILYVYVYVYIYMYIHTHIYIQLNMYRMLVGTPTPLLLLARCLTAVFFRSSTSTGTATDRLKAGCLGHRCPTEYILVVFSNPYS